MLNTQLNQSYRSLLQPQLYREVLHRIVEEPWDKGIGYKQLYFFNLVHSSFVLINVKIKVNEQKIKTGRYNYDERDSTKRVWIIIKKYWEIDRE